MGRGGRGGGGGGLGVWEGRRNLDQISRNDLRDDDLSTQLCCQLFCNAEGILNRSGIVHRETLVIHDDILTGLLCMIVLLCCNAGRILV